MTKRNAMPKDELLKLAKIDLTPLDAEYALLDNPGLMPLADMLHYVGKPCDSWSPGCPNCDAWHNWRVALSAVTQQHKFKCEMEQQDAEIEEEDRRNPPTYWNGTPESWAAMSMEARDAIHDAEFERLYAEYAEDKSPN